MALSVTTTIDSIYQLTAAAAIARRVLGNPPTCNGALVASACTPLIYLKDIANVCN
jgi:hypothetical protein